MKTQKENKTQARKLDKGECFCGGELKKRVGDFFSFFKWGF